MVLGLVLALAPDGMAPAEAAALASAALRLLMGA